MAAPRVYLPAPRYVGEPGGDPVCERCAGTGVSGDRYELASDIGAGAPLLVDEFCGQCQGCGRATHDGCAPLEHADIDRGEIDDEDLDDLDEVCPSCWGRQWWACQAFNGGVVSYLRLPCGCATSLLVEVSAVDSAVSEQPPG